MATPIEVGAQSPEAIREAEIKEFATMLQMHGFFLGSARNDIGSFLKDELQSLCKREMH